MTGQKANNLGFPINSHKDESSLIITKNNKTAFFASNRGDRFDLDLYTLCLPENMQSNKFVEIGGIVLDSISLKPVNDCKIIFYNQDSFYFKTYSNSEGYFIITVPEQENININIVSENHLFLSRKIQVGNVILFQFYSL